MLGGLEYRMVWDGHHVILKEGHSRFNSCLAVSDIYPMFIEPSITWVPSGFSGYIWLDTKLCLKILKSVLAIHRGLSVLLPRSVGLLGLLPDNLNCEVTTLLVSAFIISRLDYCNCVLADLQHQPSRLAPLQRVLKCCCSMDYGLGTIGSLDAGSLQTILDTNYRAHQFQTASLGTPSYRWSSAIVFDWIGHLYGQHPWLCYT